MWVKCNKCGKTWNYRGSRRRYIRCTCDGIANQISQAEIEQIAKKAEEKPLAEGGKVQYVQKPKTDLELGKMPSAKPELAKVLSTAISKPEGIEIVKPEITVTPELVPPTEIPPGIPAPEIKPLVPELPIIIEVDEKIVNGIIQFPFGIIAERRKAQGKLYEHWYLTDSESKMAMPITKKIIEKYLNKYAGKWSEEVLLILVFGMIIGGKLWKDYESGRKEKEEKEKKKKEEKPGEISTTTEKTEKPDLKKLGL